jgi:hypothetical protein
MCPCFRLKVRGIHLTKTAVVIDLRLTRAAMDMKCQTFHLFFFGSIRDHDLAIVHIVLSCCHYGSSEWCGPQPDSCSAVATLLANLQNRSFLGFRMYTHIWSRPVCQTILTHLTWVIAFDMQSFNVVFGQDSSRVRLPRLSSKTRI